MFRNRYGTVREKSDNKKVLFLDSPNSCPSDVQESRQHSMTTPDEGSNIFPLISTTPQISKKFVRDEKTNEI